eukprot:2577936-Rhodomonas_salina.1
MRRWKSCRTRRATSFGNRFHPAGGSGSAEGSAEVEQASGGSGMGATCDRSLVNADVGAMAGATRDRNCMGRAGQSFNVGGCVLSLRPGVSRLVRRRVKGHAHVGFDLD